MSLPDDENYPRTTTTSAQSFLSCRAELHSASTHAKDQEKTGILLQHTETGTVRDNQWLPLQLTKFKNKKLLFRSVNGSTHGEEEEGEGSCVCLSRSLSEQNADRKCRCRNDSLHRRQTPTASPFPPLPPRRPLAPPFAQPAPLPPPPPRCSARRRSPPSAAAAGAAPSAAPRLAWRRQAPLRLRCGAVSPLPHPCGCRLSFSSPPPTPPPFQCAQRDRSSRLGLRREEGCRRFVKKWPLKKPAHVLGFYFCLPQGWWGGGLQNAASQEADLKRRFKLQAQRRHSCPCPPRPPSGRDVSDPGHLLELLLMSVCAGREAVSQELKHPMLKALPGRGTSRWTYRNGVAFKNNLFGRARGRMLTFG
ncbi:uncharacterized protein LOC121080746 [Falco naumanni]|uniref:uncharacterized protein LOC121080746 n=1 Tax=Falco naumanni TaxID=148594 RepID=UPI001ADE5B48|nr:uncharacterized protein LOC121080746 [Falco naumanni]